MSTDPVPERYRRRRYWPVVTMIIVVLAGAGFVWLTALKPAAAAGAGCNLPGPAPTTSASPTKTKAPATTGTKKAGTTAPRTTAASTPASTVATTLGTFTDANTLANTRPADPTTIDLQVFNASNVRGQAGTVTAQLRSVGFSSIQAAANDPLYPASDLNCVGEIRYGPAGVAAARTVLIMAPCAQLIMDDRADASVDLSLGARYTFGPVSDQVKKELEQIVQAATPPPVIEGQTEAAKPLPPIPPLPTANCSNA